VKIGNLHITRRVNSTVRAYLLSPPGRELVAKMARAEVKNYLAELAEQADMPFDNAEAFLRKMNNLMAYARGERGAYNPDTDPPELFGADLGRPIS